MQKSGITGHKTGRAGELLDVLWADSPWGTQMWVCRWRGDGPAPSIPGRAVGAWLVLGPSWEDPSPPAGTCRAY